MFDPYLEWLKIPPERRPPTHYELLGLPAYESDAARIHKAVLDRMALVRRYQLGEHADTVVRLLNELSAAFNCLSDPQRRREYDDQLRAEAADAPTVSMASASLTATQEIKEPIAAKPSISRATATRRGWRIQLAGLVAASLAAVFVIIWMVQQPSVSTVQQTDFTSRGLGGGSKGTTSGAGVQTSPVGSEPIASSNAAQPGSPKKSGKADSSIRYFGYATAGPNSVIGEIAPYTNVVLVQDWVAHPRGMLVAARQAGLPMVLCLRGKEMTDGAEQLRAALRRGTEPVLAVCWFYPYAAGFKPADVINVGKRLKQEHPDVQFWMASPDKTPNPPENDIVPVVVDALVVTALGDTTPAAVRAKAEESLPRWQEKAWGRPIIWLWFSASRFNKAGIVPTTQPGTFREYLQQARRFQLAGLIFDCYGQPEGQERVSLDARPELIDEIRQISSELKLKSVK